MSGDAGDVTVVGVVHDHPASVYRARRAVEFLDPSVVAVEVPPLALPAFETRDGADGAGTGPDGSRPSPDGGRPTLDGDEMSAALAAADGRTAGIDGVDAGFLRTLVATLRREGASRATYRATAGSVAGITRRALACRLGALAGRPARPGSGDCNCTAADDPATQAADERRHRSRSQTLLGAVERPHAEQVIDATREAAMARRIAALRTSGDVVAVVGFDHLDAVAEALEDRGD